jgi:hypothetical protein
MRTPRPFLSNAILLLAIGLLLPVNAFAQTGAASLTGIVTDQSGAGGGGAGGAPPPPALKKKQPPPPHRRRVVG